MPHQQTLPNSKSSGLTRSGYSARIWVLSTKLFRLLAAFLLEKQSEYQNIYFEYCGKFKTKIWFFFGGGKPCPTCSTCVSLQSRACSTNSYGITSRVQCHAGHADGWSTEIPTNSYIFRLRSTKQKTTKENHLVGCFVMFFFRRRKK